MRALVLLVPLVLCAAAAQGQVRPEPARPDSLRADSLRADSLRADSAATPELVPDPEAEAIIQELRTLPGYVPTGYLGERAIYRTDEGTLRLMGEARVDREGNQLAADTIVYREGDNLVEAYGSPSVQGEAQELSGDVLYYDLATRRATAYGAETQFTERGTWFVSGDMTVESAADTRIFATGGHFTTCDLAIPHYHFEADQVKIVRGKYLVGRPARLYFGRVPVAILPFFVQSLEEGRRSGLIVPRFGLTDVIRNSGHTREISDLGWYWAVNDYLGAQVTGKWRSGAYTALTGNVDFRWRRQFLDGNLGFTRYWENDGSRNFALDSRAAWQPDERTRMSGSARFASSSRFIRETTIDPLEATQDLASQFSLTRRFDWGTIATGADARQSMADGGLTYTLPSLSISPNPVTFLRSTSPDLARWYNDVTFSWDFRGTRRGTENEADLLSGKQDQQELDLSGNAGINVGRLGLSTGGQLNQRVLEELSGVRLGNNQVGPCPSAAFPPGLAAPCDVKPGGHRDEGGWRAALSYQQPLIGSTTLTPSLGISRAVRRDSLTNDAYVQAPMRTNFAASLSTSIFGFYNAAIGPFSRFRHRLSPTLQFTYSPAVRQNARQDSIFGAIESRTQNVITFGFNQTFEAKLRRPQRDPQRDSTSALMDSTTVGDTLMARAVRPPVPQDEQIVKLLSINTSSFAYDFTRARETGNGFKTTTVTNSFTSDYLNGLTIQMAHDLFDRSQINPDSAVQRGEMGRFAPRLSSLSTGFDLGPTSAIFRWLGLTGNASTAPTEGEIPGPEGRGPGEPGGSSTSTGNNRGFGSGQWRASVDYAFSRPQRTWDPGGLRDDRAVQTLNLSASLPLTPGWSADWRTSYSITDSEFAGQSLNFSRDLHRWRANFSFFQTATGNSGFVFYVELIDNTDLQFEYNERNLGIDR